jgi:chemotaxis protein methyltransferase CheR
VTTLTVDGFLAWALPQRGLRWRGFRRNRRQVVRRLQQRIAALGLGGPAAYRRFLDEHPDEWPVLDGLCRVTISRFARDREMWDVLVSDVLPRLAGEGSTVTAWSAGCGAGEEPFTLAIVWALEIAPRWPGVELHIVATDIDDVQLARAATGEFPSGALRELGEPWQAAAFDGPRLRERFRASVRFERRDLRSTAPDGPFDLVLCRNLAYSYFDDVTQRAVTASFRAALRTGGVLVVGSDESLPDGAPGFARSTHGIYDVVGDSPGGDASNVSVRR